MTKKLNLSVFDNGINKIEIGVLKQEVIDYFNLNRESCNIVLWKDRVKYTEKHKKDFKNEEEYNNHMTEIPNIIGNPDYIGLHPSNNSIQYIKKINEIMLVGIRIKTKGDLNLRSSYPISIENLNRYIRSGTVIEYNKIIDRNE